MAPIVSTDDHVVENPELWSSRLSRSRFGDRVPHIERQADGADCWIIEGKRLPLLGSGSAGALTIDRTGEPRRFEEIAAQAWKPSQRLAAMNRDGIDFSVLYPSVAGVAGETFARSRGSERVERLGEKGRTLPCPCCSRNSGHGRFAIPTARSSSGS